MSLNETRCGSRWQWFRWQWFRWQWFLMTLQVEVPWRGSPKMLLFGCRLHEVRSVRTERHPTTARGDPSTSHSSAVSSGDSNRSSIFITTYYERSRSVFHAHLSGRPGCYLYHSLKSVYHRLQNCVGSTPQTALCSASDGAGKRGEIRDVQWQMIELRRLWFGFVVDRGRMRINGWGR